MDLVVPPAIVVVLALEGRPQVLCNATTGSEERRIVDWIASQEELLDLVGRAIDLSEAAA